MTNPSRTGPASIGDAFRLGRQARLDRVWQGLFGSPDLGPVDFGTLRRRRSPNDALACPHGFCPGAEPDFVPPVFPVPGERLRVIVADIALSEPNMALVHSDPAQDRYLVRTRLMRFPDTIVVQIIEIGKDRSTLAAYSRSQIGRSDLGVNRRRLERWIARIGTLAAQERTRSSP